MSSSSNENQKNNQEIDLGMLFSSLKNFIDNIGFTIFRICNFYIRNYIITILLILIGVGLAYYQTSNNSKKYKHEVILVPNFNGTGYLYNKIGNFGKSNSDQEPNLQHINNLQIEPIIDVFQFISDSKFNLEIAKYMSENTIEVNKFKKNSDVEKLYRYHKLTYYTDVPDFDLKVYQSLIDNLNNDAYLKNRKNIEVAETQHKLVEYQNSVDNINNIFKKLGVASESSKDFNVEMYSQINDLMLTKNDLLKEINKTKIELIEKQKIIYDASNNLNMKNGNFFDYILYPVILNFLFLLFAWIFKQSKRYKLRIQS